MSTRVLLPWLVSFCLILLCQAISLGAPIVSYKLDRDAAGTYRVYMNSTTSYTGTLARIGSAQVTVRVPTGTLATISQGTGSPLVTGYQSMGWTAGTRVITPAENPAFDYISFNFNQSATPTLFNITANQDILLFSFSDNGSCPGPLTLWTVSDPFQGTSTSTNPGNQITILGAGAGNSYSTTYGGPTNCGLPDLVVSTGPVPVLTAGQTASLPVSVNNIGTATAAGPLSFVTNLPTGISAPSSFTTNGWGCTTSSQTISCSSPASLSAGSSQSFSLPITPLATAVGTTPVFSGSVSSPTPEANTANNTSTPVSPPQAVQPGAQPDLVVSTGPVPVLTAGQTASLPVSVNNIGTATAAGPLSFVTNLPTGISAPSSFTTNGWGCTTSSQTISCSSPASLSAGSSQSFSLPITPLATAVGTTPVFSGSVSSPTPEANTANNTSTPVSPPQAVQPGAQPDLVVSTGPVPVLTAGQTASLPVSVNNIGTATAAGPLSFVTNLPTGISAPSSFTTNGWGCTTSSQTISCSSPASLSAGSSQSFSLPITPLATAVGTTPVFSGSVSSPTPEANTANNTSTPVSPPQAVQPASACVSGTDCGIGVRYGIKLASDGLTYLVYMKSANTYTGSAARIVTAQVTLNVPTGTQFINVTNLQTGMNWALNARVNHPTEASTKDYPSFGYSQSSSPSLFTITAEQEIPLFSFQLSSCLGAIGLWSLSDPFQGVSTTTNPGNQMTVAGNGITNAWKCNYTCPIACPTPVLNLVKQAPSGIIQNTPFDYSFLVTNQGNAATAGALSVTDILPAGMTFVSGGGNGWTCSATGQTVTCSSSTPIAISASSSFTLRVNPTLVGTQLNTATVTGGGISTTITSASCTTCPTGPTSATVAVQLSDLSISIQQPSSLLAGQASSLPITVTNLLAGVATGPQTVSVTLPAGVSAPASFAAAGGWGCITSGQSVVCSVVSSLSASQTLSLSIPITPSSSVIGQSLPFSATVTMASNETNVVNNVASLQTSGVVLGADLSIVFGPLPTLQPGQPAQIPLIISNVGQAPVPSSLTLTATLPAGVALNTAALPAGWSLLSSQSGAGGITQVTLLGTNAGGLSAGSSFTLNLPVVVLSTASGLATFQAVLSQVPAESNLTNNSASVSTTLGSPDLQLSITGPSPAFEVTKPSVISLAITNVGTAIATGPVTAQLVLPAGYTANQLSLPAGWSIQSSTVNGSGVTTLVLVNSVTSLSPTQVLSLTVAITPGAATANVTGSISASVVPATGETNTSNNTGSVTGTPVAPRIVATLTLPNQFTATQPGNATVVFTNTGTAPYTGPLTTQMTLPTNVTLGSLPTGWFLTGQQTNGNGTITYTLYNPSVSLPINGSSTLIVPLLPDASLAGQSLPVVVTTPTLPSNPGSASSVTATSPVVSAAAPNVIVSIGSPTPPLSVGQTSLIPITFINIGNATANGPISTTISIPAGISVVQGQLPAGWFISTSTAGPNGSTIYTLVNSGASISASGGQLGLNLPVAISQPATVTPPTVTVVIQPGGQITPGSGTYTSPAVTAPNVVLTVGQPTPALVVGQTSYIPVTIQNFGSGTAFGPLVAQVALPAGVSLNQALLNLPAGWVLTSNAAGPNGTTLVTLTSQNTNGFLPGGSIQLSVPVIPNASTVGTQPVFTVTVLPVLGQTTSPTQTVVANVAVQAAQAPDLTISGGQPQPGLTVGQSSNLPITIQNVGNATANGPISFQIALPAGATLNTAQLTAGWYVQSQVTQPNGAVVVTFVNPSLNLIAGQSIAIAVPIIPGSSLLYGLISMDTYVNPVTGETNLANNLYTIVTTVPVQPAPAPDLSVIIPNQSFVLASGQTSNITFNVANIGTVATTGTLSLQFAMPTGFTTNPAAFTTNTWGCSTVSSVVTCTNSTGLGIGASSSLSIPVLPTNAAGGLVNPSFQINVAQTTGETVLANNVGTLNYAGVVAGADLAVSFPAQSFTLVAGQPANLSITVSNAAPLAAATGPLSVTLALPVNFSTSTSSFVTNGWTCSTTGTTVGCVTSSSLAAGGSLGLVIPVVPSTGAVGYSNLTFGASVAPVAGETNLANNVAYLTYAGTVLPGGISLAIKAILQGAYDGSTGLMQDKLRQKNLIPLVQPYGGASGGNSTYTFINSGNETTTTAILSVTGVNAIVDWVMVELHSAANPATIVATKPALIQRDGDVVSSTDGVSPISFSYLTSGSYYVVVRHRNHLGIMSAQAMALSPTTTTVDLTIPANLYKLAGAGNYPAFISNTMAMLWAGNTNGDNQVIFQGPNTDLDPIFYRIMSDPGNTGFVANYITNGYYVTDVNMDGTTIFQGPSNEVDVIFFDVIGHPDNTSYLANFIIRQHLP